LKNKIATFVCSKYNPLCYDNPIFVSVAFAAARRRALVLLSPPYQRHPLALYTEIGHGGDLFLYRIGRYLCCSATAN
jgi:hypothetical protein